MTLSSRAPDIRRRDRVEALTTEATKEHAESLLRGIDALTRKFAMLGPVPLDVLDRYQRILQAAHVDNQIRVSRFTERSLLELES